MEALTSSASHKDGTYTVTITNAELTGSKNVNVTLSGLNGKIREAKAILLSSDKMNSCNTFDEPDRICEKETAVNIVSRNEVQLTIPAMSLVTLSCSL